ncbi:MAG: hypothetical protein SGPRY_008382 [Prymnesium sp.]
MESVPWSSSLGFGLLECLFAACSFLCLLAGASTTLHTSLILPSASVWLELLSAFLIGSSFNILLATFVWQYVSPSLHPPRSPLAYLPPLGACGLAIALPPALPYALPLSSSAHALLAIIGAWKVIDALAGTRAQAVVGNGRLPFIIFVTSAVEYKTDGRSIPRAKPMSWLRELAAVGCTFAGLALSISMVRLMSTEGPPLLSSPQLKAWVRLYAEVWTIYLFLNVFTGSFSTLLALAGYTPQIIFRNPLLRGTSISDFWSRRWNMLIHGLIKRTVFLPLLAVGMPSWTAGLAARAFHEYAFALQQPELAKSLGRCLAFFVLQAPIVSLEKLLAEKLPIPWPLRRYPVLCTLGWTLLLVPFAPLFMHPLRTSGVLDQIFLLTPRLSFT